MNTEANIKKGDLVTIELANFSEESNTYIVEDFTTDGRAVLKHPLSSECYIIKELKDLNNTQPIMKSPLEYCLWFLKKHKDNLGYNNILALESILLLYITKRSLSSAQKHEIHKMCGKVAAIHTDGNVAFAAKRVCEKVALLDPYNLREFKRIEKYFKNPETVVDTSHRQVILRVAGFILAQGTE